MASAWRVLDQAAEAAQAPELHPLVWEVALQDGTVAAIVRTLEEARLMAGDGSRRWVVYTLDEIGRMLFCHSAVTEAKLTFPGATVEEVRRPGDPLDAFADTAAGLDDEIQDDIPFFGA